MMQELVLHDSQLLPRECLEIARSPHVRHLRTLDLSCNHIGLEGLCSLFDPTTNLTRLATLELYSCGISAPAHLKAKSSKTKKTLIK